MHMISDKLGSIIKTARLDKHLTQKRFAKKMNISPRHLAAIENENQKPSYGLLYCIIRELAISADIIFYPELEYNHSEMWKLWLLLAQCNEKEMRAIFAILQSLLNYSEETG